MSEKVTSKTSVKQASSNGNNPLNTNGDTMNHSHSSFQSSNDTHGAMPATAEEPTPIEQAVANLRKTLPEIQHSVRELLAMIRAARSSAPPEPPTKTDG